MGYAPNAYAYISQRASKFKSSWSHCPAPHLPNGNSGTGALKSWINNTFLWIISLKLKAAEGQTAQTSGRVSFKCNLML
jgi:hypothetical protein